MLGGSGRKGYSGNMIGGGWVLAVTLSVEGLGLKRK